jgi:hypothetical protein
MTLKSLLLVPLASLVLVSASGCHLFGKPKKPKSNIASEVESSFRQRWIEHRTAELTTKDTDAVTARRQAETEFQEKYQYLKDGK